MDQRRSGGRPDCPSRQAGQVMPLLVAVLAFVTLVLLGVARLGAAANQLARARTAADAAALAGAADGRRAAAQLAAKNGARLVTFDSVGTDTIVTVIVGDTRAMARARRTEQSGAEKSRPLAARGDPV